MDSVQFYGSRTTSRRFLHSAFDEVAENSSRNIDIVILPPETGDSVESDEDEGNDEDGLDDEYMPADVPGEVEIHMELDDSAEDSIDDQPTVERWRSWFFRLQKRWKSSLCEVER